MEFILFYILILFLELYTAVILLYVIIQLLRKKKLPWRILILELLCILSFFYLKFLLDRHKLIVFGSFNEAPEDWGAGLANVMTYTYNLAFIIGLFLITQLIFWIFFKRKFQFLNYQNSKNAIDLDNFLKEEKPE